MPTPTLVQVVSTQANGSFSSNTGNGFVVSLPHPTLAGNVLIFTLTHHYSASRTVSIIDNKGNTWPSASVISNDTSNTVTVRIYVTAPAAGTQTFTVTFDTNIGDVHFTISEWYNVSTTLDGSSSNINSGGGPTITAGSFTPGTSGDLIYNFAVETHGGAVGAGTQPTSFTKGSGFTKLACDRHLATYSQYQVQVSAAPINPTVTMNGIGSSEANSVAIALLAASAGTAPTGMRIVHLFHMILESTSPSVRDIPSQGNLVVCGFSINGDSGGNNITSVSDGTNTYTKQQPNIAAGCLFHADNAATSTELVITITSPSPGNNTDMMVYDISGAATAPYDTSVAATGLSQPATNADLDAAPNFTPTESGGLVIAMLQMGAGPPSGLATPTGGIFLCVWHTGMTDASLFNLGEGHALYFNPDTTAEDFKWHISNQSQASSCNGVAFSLKAGPTSSDTFTESLKYQLVG